MQPSVDHRGFYPEPVALRVDQREGGVFIDGSTAGLSPGATLQAVQSTLQTLKVDPDAPPSISCGLRLLDFQMVFTTAEELPRRQAR